MQWTRFDDELPPPGVLVLVRHWNGGPIIEKQFLKADLASGSPHLGVWIRGEWVLAPDSAKPKPKPCGAFLKWVRNEAGKVSFEWDHALTVWFDNGDKLGGFPISPEQASSAIDFIDAIDNALAEFKRLKGV